MRSEPPVSSGETGFFGFLTIVFIAFKLAGIIDWSWWWVLAPVWIPVAIVTVILAIAFALMLKDDKR